MVVAGRGLVNLPLPEVDYRMQVWLSGFPGIVGPQVIAWAWRHAESRRGRMGVWSGLSRPGLADWLPHEQRILMCEVRPFLLHPIRC